MPIARIRILVVEDHQVVREGLRALLETAGDLEVIGEASDGETAVARAAALAPDVVVMDLGLPQLDGIEATRRIRAARSLTQVVILSMHDEPDRVERALRAGAAGYVLKGQGIRSLCDAIRCARRGERYLSEDLRGYLAGGGRAGVGEGEGEGRPADGLSDREREVLTLIAEGLTSREIGERLALKPKTIENHRARIMEKLEIHTTAGLVRYALRGRS